MIERILAGATTQEDVEQARALDFAGRKKLMERLLGTLDGSFEEAVLLGSALEDVNNALRQAKPVFAAGLPVDQALGFIVKMVQDSLDELAEAGAADSDEYEKQELVHEKLSAFLEACETSGVTQGEDAFEVVHGEYRGEVGQLETLKAKAESGLANSLAFLETAYGDGAETAAFVKGIDRNHAASRFIGMFGSKSFFAFKHVAAPGETSENASANDAEED